MSDTSLRHRRARGGASPGGGWLRLIGSAPYSLYVIAVGLICFLATGLGLMLTPGQMRRRRLARFGVRSVFFFARIPVRVDGLAHLPDGPCVVVANHRSYLDGPALIAALPARFTPIIKAEIGRVPVLATVLRRAGARFVRRTPVMKAGRDAAAMLEGLQRGESLALFPEGTFSVDAGLLPFREGAFFLAAKTGYPVVPAAIEGTQAALPLGNYMPRFAEIHVEVSAPLTAAGEKRPQSRELRGRTEVALWDGLRPAGAGARCAVAGHRYYEHAFRDCIPPFAYLDLDRLRLRLRRLLEQSRGKRLRVDARVLSSPAVIDRVLRSDIRFEGALCNDVAQAVHLAEIWCLRDMVIASPVADEAGLHDVCKAIARGADISLNVAASADVEAAATVAERHGVEIPLCVMLGTSIAGGGASAAAVADLLSLLDAIERWPAVFFRGVIEQHRWSADAQAQYRRAERERAGIRLQLVERGYERPLYSICASADLRQDALDTNVSELVIGRELFAIDDDETSAWPVAGCVLSSPEDAGTGVALQQVAFEAALAASNSAEGGDVPEWLFFAAPDVAVLDTCFDRLYLVQGGALVNRIETARVVGHAGTRPPDRRRRPRRTRRRR